MRTTLTINDELMAALKKRAYETGKTFKAVVNETLTLGLEAVPAKNHRPKKYKTPGVSLGTESLEVTKSVLLAGALEDEELARKMALRK